MSISIIIWFFDKITNLKETFISIQEQNYKNFEIIIIDDSEKINNNNDFNLFFDSILDNKNIKIITMLKNEGIFSSWNIAKKYAKNEYIWFLKEGQILINKNVLKNIFINQKVIENKPDIIESNMSLNNKSEVIVNKCLEENKLYKIQNNKEVLVYMNMYIDTKILKLKTINNIKLKFNDNKNYELLFIYKLMLNAKTFLYLNIHSIAIIDLNYKFSYLNLLKQWPHIFNYIKSDPKYDDFFEEIIYSFFKYVLLIYPNLIKIHNNKVLNKKSISWISKRVQNKIYLYNNNKYIKYNPNDNFNNYSDKIENYLKSLIKKYI